MEQLRLMLVVVVVVKRITGTLFWLAELVVVEQMAILQIAILGKMDLQTQAVVLVELRTLPVQMQEHQQEALALSLSVTQTHTQMPQA
jgi:hypothetical protein